MDLLKRLLLAAVILFTTCPAYATVYQYFDEEGTLIVTDNPYGIRKPRPPRSVETNPDIKLPYRNDVSYDFYPVSGKNIEEVLSSIKINGPFDSGEGMKFAGQTKWKTGWSYKFSSSYEGDGSYLYVSLNIFDIEFLSDISVLLPELQEKTALSPHDLMLWEQFLQKLVEHEHDHVKIITDPSYRNEAVRKFSAIKQLTLPYDRQTDPDTLIKDAVESETARIGHDLVLTIKQQNDEYDRVTEHGVKPEMRNSFFGR